MELRKINYKITTPLLLMVIFAVSVFLRLYHLDKNTPNVFIDELTGGYTSFHLLNSSIRNLPDLFDKIFYGITHFTWMFGLTPLGARSASALYGSFFSLVFFFFALSIAKRIIPNKGLITALFSSFLITVLPWSFMVSRIGYSSIPAMILLVCLHLTILMSAKNTLGHLFSLIPLGIGIIFYPSLVIIAPIAILLVFSLMTAPLNQSKKILRWSVFAAIIILFGLVGISRFNMLNPKARGLDLAIWRDVNVTAENDLYRGIAGESHLTKIFYNYPTSVIGVFTKNYLSFFSLDFLFLKGDNVLRHSTGMVGEFLPFLLPFMLYGAYVFFTKADKKLKTIFLVWILISPVPAAITKDGATYLLRAITMMPFLTYFCAQGIVSSFDIFKNIYLKIIYGLVILGIGLYSIGGFLFGYFRVYPTLSAQSWESGFKELSDFQVTHPGKLLTIWDDKYPVWYFCFWQRLPGNVCNQSKMGKNEMVNNSRVDLPIDSLLFSLPQTESDLNQIVKIYKPTYVAIPDKYEIHFPSFIKNASLVQTIKYPDQKIAFSVYKISR